MILNCQKKFFFQKTPNFYDFKLSKKFFFQKTPNFYDFKLSKNFFQKNDKF